MSKWCMSTCKINCNCNIRLSQSQTSIMISPPALYNLHQPIKLMYQHDIMLIADPIVSSLYCNTFQSPKTIYLKYLLCNDD